MLSPSRVHCDCCFRRNTCTGIGPSKLYVGQWTAIAHSEQTVRRWSSAKTAYGSIMTLGWRTTAVIVQIDTRSEQNRRSIVYYYVHEEWANVRQRPRSKYAVGMPAVSWCEGGRRRRRRRSTAAPTPYRRRRDEGKKKPSPSPLNTWSHAVEGPIVYSRLPSRIAQPSTTTVGWNRLIAAAAAPVAEPWKAYISFCDRFSREPRPCAYDPDQFRQVQLRTPHSHMHVCIIYVKLFTRMSPSTRDEYVISEDSLYSI